MHVVRLAYAFLGTHRTSSGGIEKFEVRPGVTMVGAEGRAPSSQKAYDRAIGKIKREVKRLGYTFSRKLINTRPEILDTEYQAVLKKKFKLTPTEHILNGTTAALDGPKGEILYRFFECSYFHVETPQAVVIALNKVIASHRRVNIYYGNVKTGRDWLESNDRTGRVWVSDGPLRVPILVNRGRGGNHVLDHCIVRIRYSCQKNRHEYGHLYIHPNYHRPRLTVAAISPLELDHEGRPLIWRGLSFKVLADNKPHTYFSSYLKAKRFVDKLS